MDNKQFRDAIYVKYEYQQKHNNEDFLIHITIEKILKKLY